MEIRQLEFFPTEVPPLTVESWFLQSFPASRGLHNFLTIGPNYPQVHSHHQPEIASAISLPVVSTASPTAALPLTDEEKEIIRELEGINGRALLNSAPERARLGAISDRIERMNSPSLLFNRELVYYWSLLAGVETGKVSSEMPADVATLSKRLEVLIDGIYAPAVALVPPQMLAGFTSQQLKLILGQVESFELSQGCSVRCSFCGVNSPTGVTGHIAFGDLLYLMRNHGPERKDRPLWENRLLMLYKASEPLDYQDGLFTVEDVFALVLFYLRVVPQIMTALPKGRGQVFWRLQSKGWINDVSIHGINLKRAVLPYGLLEKEKSTGDYRIREFEHPPRFRVFDDVARRVWFANEGKKVRFAKAGRNFDGHCQPTENDHGLGSNGIECSQGVTVKGDGFYNTAGTKPDSGNTSGVIEVKIGPDNFARPLEAGRNYELQDAMSHGVVENHYQRVYGAPLPLVIISDDGTRHGFNYDPYAIEYWGADLELLTPMTPMERRHSYVTRKVKRLNGKEMPGGQFDSSDMPALPQKP